MTDDALARYVTDLFAHEDDALRAVRTGHAEAELPAIHVSAHEGSLLHVLTRAVGARQVLEVGTLGGYSGTWIARALPPGGRLTTVEGSERHAAYARGGFARAGVEDRVDVVVGEALDTLAALSGPYDIVFLDADKAPLPRYFEHGARLLRLGGLLLCDNTFMDGRIVDDGETSSDVVGMRTFNRLVADDPRFAATVVPVRDGLLVAVKVAD